MNIVSTTFLPIASIGIGCFLLYAAWKTYAATRNMSDWEIAKGVITKSDIKPVGEVPTGAVPCIPDVEYQYFVLGVEYKGVSVTLALDQQSERPMREIYTDLCHPGSIGVTG